MPAIAIRAIRIASEMNVGDRVRIASGPWSSDCGTILRIMANDMAIVEVDTGSKQALVYLSDCQLI